MGDFVLLGSMELTYSRHTNSLNMGRGLEDCYSVSGLVSWLRLQILDRRCCYLG